MPGTTRGGKAAAQKNKELYGEDYYKIIGSKGGKISRGGGWAHDSTCDCSEYPETHYKRRCAGARGGRVSKRTKDETDN